MNLPNGRRRKEEIQLAKLILVMLVSDTGTTVNPSDSASVMLVNFTQPTAFSDDN